MDWVRLIALGAAALFLVACGETTRIVDAGLDAGGDTGPPDAALDATSDAPPDDAGPRDSGPRLEGIDTVLAAVDGAVDIAIDDGLVTYFRPGDFNDEPGFFVQSAATGPALFVEVEPTPGLAVGDRVSFRVTAVETRIGHLRATEIADLVTMSSGNDIGAFVQTVSATEDLVSNLDDYAHELVRVDFTITGVLESGGVGFTRATVETAGVTGDPRLQFRVPELLRIELSLATGCSAHAEGVPLWGFNEFGQISAWNLGEITDVVCP